MDKKQERLKKRQEAFSERLPGLSKLDPKVEVKLGGKTWTLHFTNYAIKRVFEDTKHNLMTGLKEEHLSNPVIFGAVLFRGMEQEHPELTQEVVDRMFSLRHYAYVREKVVEALELFYPDLSDLPVESEGEEQSTEHPT